MYAAPTPVLHNQRASSPQVSTMIPIFLDFWAKKMEIGRGLLQPLYFSMEYGFAHSAAHTGPTPVLHNQRASSPQV